MQKLHFTITIDAPRAKVWELMLGDATYRQWTEAFGAGSHYVGRWDEGADIRFLAPDENGVMMGMVSRIKTNRPHEYLSIEHRGVIAGGEVDTSSEAVQAWAGALENYTFRENGGRTELLVDLDTHEDYKTMFEDMWPKALQRLKILAEN